MKEKKRYLWFARRILFALVGKKEAQEIAQLVRRNERNQLPSNTKRNGVLSFIKNFVTSESVQRLVLELILFLVKRGGKI